MFGIFGKKIADYHPQLPHGSAIAAGESSRYSFYKCCSEFQEGSELKKDF